MSADSPISREIFRTGEFIFKEGDVAFDFFIVERGEVEIFSLDTNNHRVVIAKVGEGESFGEFALLDKSKRSASAVATSEVIVNRVTEEGYQQLLSELPDWASSMLKSFASRLKLMNKRLKDLPQFIDKK
jgi:CRP/FNR family cyclic AMP-dependent transcriptional regulator